MFNVEDVVLIEIIKICVGTTIGAIILHYRAKAFNSIRTSWLSMKQFVSSIKQGINVLGSDEFQKLPNDVIELKRASDIISKKVLFIEGKVGPNGGSSLLDGIEELKRNVKTLQHNVSSLMLNNQQMIDATGTLMFTLNRNGEFTWVSKSLQELIGYSFEEGFKNHQWENLYFPEDLPNIRRRWQDAIALSLSIEGKVAPDQPETILTLRTRFRHNETEEEIPAHIRLSKMPDGSISGIVTTEKQKRLVDVTL